MDRKVTFDLFKNIIIQQNEVLIKKIAEETNTPIEKLRLKYLKREFYLPIVVSTTENKKT